MRAFVRFRLPDGDIRELGPGDQIGRMWSAALSIPDPAVSEAHAMVSLRGSTLKLFALRGRFAVDHKPQTEVELAPGLVIQLTPDLTITVVELILPDAVLALEGDGLARQVLSGVASLRVRPRPELVPGLSSDSDATVWSDGLGWLVRLGPPSAAAEAMPLVEGDTFEAHGHRFTAVAVPLGHAGQAVTLGVGVGEPLQLIVRYDTVHIHRESEPSLALDGISARIVSELAIVRLPVSWEAIGREIWDEEDDVVALRRKWDTAVARLRKKLRDHRIRPDLVRADGTGNFELFLQKGDQVVDET